MKNILATLGILVSFSTALAGNGSGTMASVANTETKPGDQVYLLNEVNGYVQYAQGEYIKDQWSVKKITKAVTALDNKTTDALSKSYEQSAWATVGN